MLKVRFCNSDLWSRQALAPTAFPPAIQEKDFIVPGDGFQSHDGRRNLTDLQETAQWLGGPAVAKAILSGLLGSFVLLWCVLLCLLLLLLWH